MGLRFKPAALLLTALGITRAAQAQDSTYLALHQEPQGRQIVAIYVGATDCAPCVWPAVKAAVRQMWPRVAAQAKSAGAAFATLGVALDEQVDSGLALLQPLSQFDEISIGGGWVNHDVERYIWSDTTGVPAIPQVLVIEREVNASNGKTQWSVSPYHVLFRVIGGDPIRGWVAKGAPVSIPPPAQ